MPIIQGYEDHIQAQGGLNVRANPDDFGAQIGQGMQRLGAGLGDAADAVFKHAEMQDTTKAHVEVAKARPQFDQTLLDKANQTQPGDETLAPGIVKDISEWSTKAAEGAATPAGKRLYLTLGANMASEFGQRAVSIQAELAAREAINQNKTLNIALGGSAFANPGQAGQILAQGVSAIDDPNTIYGKIPQSKRNELKQELTQNVSFGALRGIVRDKPFEFLGLASPQQLDQFKPFEKLLNANAVPGGKVSITPATMAQAPAITSAAAVEKVNPAVAMAVADMPGAKEDPKTLAQDMGALLDKFGGNYKAAVAAFHMGTDALTNLGEQFGNAWLGHLPQDTSAYVDSVMTKAGQVPSNAPTEAPAPPVAKAPVDIASLPLMKNLSWEQQDHLYAEAVRLGHLKLGMAKEAREEEKLAKGEAMKTKQEGFEQQIFRPGQYGRIDLKAMWEDTTLDVAHKEHIQNTYDRRIRELRADHESKTNPEEVRRLDGMIHAAADNPTKTYSFDPVQESYQSGRISFAERNQLLGVFEQAKDGNSAGFGARLKRLQDTAYNVLTKSIEGQTGALTGSTGNAYYSWWSDLQKQIQDKRTKGEDPSVLLDPKHKEFAGDMSRIFSFMPSAQQNLQQGAKAEKAKGVAPGTIKDGYQFIGGDPGQKKNWVKVHNDSGATNYQEGS